MDVNKLFEESSLDDIADNVFNVVNGSVSEVKAMQRKKVAENVQLVVDALKKIEADLQERYDSIGNTLEKRILTIKDGRDGINGRDGRNGKDGKNGRDGAPGARGVDGKPGMDGADGTDGVSVTDARIDFDGSLIIGLSSGREINVGEVIAPNLAEQIKVITNGGGTAQSVLDTLTSLQTQINTLIPSQTGNSGKFLTTNGTSTSWATVSGSGTVTSVAQTFTGGIVSVAGSPVTSSGTLALTVAGTSGGVPYFSSASAWASSAALAANALMIGGGAGSAPATTTTGTGVITALGVNTGTSGAFVVNGGALGTPSSGTVTNLTGTASININGTVGATTPNTGAFTTLTTSSTVTLNGGTANGVAYLNGSKVLTTGSALVFDGTNLGIGTNLPSAKLHVQGGNTVLNSAPVGSNFVFVGQTASYTSAYGENPLVQISQLRGTSSGNPLALYTWGNDGVAAELVLGKSRGTAVGTQTIVQNQDGLGVISFCGSDGTNFNQVAADILAICAGIPGATANMPGALLFRTTPSGAGSPTERMRIDSSGNVGIGGSPYSYGGGYTNLWVQASTSPVIDLAVSTTRTGTFYATSSQVTFGSVAAVPLSICTSNTDRVTISSGGSLTCPGVYSTTVGATNRDVYVDNTGLIGYVSSIRASKTEIQNLADVSWLNQLNPVSFKYRKKDGDGNYTDETDGDIQYGMIAEDVEQIRPDLCFYDEVDGKQELRGIQYSKLVPIMLKAIQELNAKVTALEAKLNQGA